MGSGMKTKVVIFCCLLILNCLEGEKPKTFNGDWVFENNKIFYQGHELKVGTHINEWIKVLGEPSRKHDFSLSHTWDSLGTIVRYKWTEPNKEKKYLVDGIEILLRDFPIQPNPDFWPSKNYKKDILVDSAIINKDTEPWQFNLNKKGKKFREGYLKSIRSFSFGSAGNNTYVRIDLNPKKQIYSFSYSLSND